MAKVVTLKDYLKQYNITKDDFMKAVEKDKEFFDTYIEWEKQDDDTIISPKALEVLGLIFNDTKTTLSEYMTAPVPIEDTDKKSPQKEKKTGEVKPKTARKRKTKLNITNQFIQENGQLDFNGSMDFKALRKFLMDSGIYKAEQMALMSDDEIISSISKDYYFITAKDNIYMMKRQVLISNKADIFVLTINSEEL